MAAVKHPVVTVFKLLGRAEHQTYDAKSNEWKADLLIQPMMVREGSDAAQDSSLQVRKARRKHKSLGRVMILGAWVNWRMYSR